MSIVRPSRERNETSSICCGGVSDIAFTRCCALQDVTGDRRHATRRTSCVLLGLMKEVVDLTLAYTYVLHHLGISAYVIFVPEAAQAHWGYAEPYVSRLPLCCVRIANSHELSITTYQTCTGSIPIAWISGTWVSTGIYPSISTLRDCTIGTDHEQVGA